MSVVNSQLIQDVVAGIVLIGGIIVYSRGRIPQQTIKNLTSLTDTYEKRIKALEDELKDNHTLQIQNVAAIADLQGQVKVYKELPLQELADGIKKVSDSNEKILKVLQDTSEINAQDRDVLTNQNLHITTEVDRIMKHKDHPK